MKRVFFILLMLIGFFSVPAKALLIDPKKCEEEKKAWDEEQRVCVAIDAHYMCCNEEEKRKKCEDNGEVYDEKRCACKPLTCEGVEGDYPNPSSEMCRAGVCSDTEDVCINVFNSDLTDSKCTCCSLSDIEDCPNGVLLSDCSCQEPPMCDSINTEEGGVYTEEMCRVGACSDAEDVCIPVAYRASGSGEFCTCCPQELINACDNAGGTIGWRTGGLQCACFDFICGADYPDNFLFADDSESRCRGRCPDTEDGKNQSCISAIGEDNSGSCACCPIDVIKECKDKGGELDANCHCCFSKCPDKEGYTVTLRDGICQYSKSKTCTAKTASDGTIIPGTEVCQ